MSLKTSNTVPARSEIIPFTLFHALKIPVYRFGQGDETGFHVIRSSGGQAFRNKSPWTDWVWCNSSYENAYMALRGKLPVKVLGLHKLRDPKRPTVLHLAFVRTTQPDNEAFDRAQAMAPTMSGVNRIDCHAILAKINTYTYPCGADIYSGRLKFTLFIYQTDRWLRSDTSVRRLTAIIILNIDAAPTVSCACLTPLSH